MTLMLGMPAVRGAEPGTQGRPDDDGLIDRFGRTAHDLRISITEKCSLRCTYCMPEEGLPAIPRHDLLTAAEIARLVRIGVHQLGIREVRFTGASRSRAATWSTSCGAPRTRLPESRCR
jgi:cyclic pyranopterin phosphate synthase